MIYNVKNMILSIPFYIYNSYFWITTSTIFDAYKTLANAIDIVCVGYHLVIYKYYDAASIEEVAFCYARGTLNLYSI